MQRQATARLESCARLYLYFFVARGDQHISFIPLEIEIDGPVQAVFDIITQARYWPEWNVLTRAVTGTIQRPFRPGDKFTEFIRTAEGTQELTWHVVDFESGKHVTIVFDPTV